MLVFHANSHRLAAGAAQMRAHPDRGVESVDIMLWVGVFISRHCTASSAA